MSKQYDNPDSLIKLKELGYKSLLFEKSIQNQECDHNIFCIECLAQKYCGGGLEIWIERNEKAYELYKKLTRKELQLELEF